MISLESTEKEKLRDTFFGGSTLALSRREDAQDPWSV